MTRSLDLQPTRTHRDRQATEFPQTSQTDPGRATLFCARGSRRCRYQRGCGRERNNDVCAAGPIPPKRNSLTRFACRGSQEERITMLKLALVEKGIILPSSHYTLPGESTNAPPARTQGSSAPAEGSLASLMQQEEMPQPAPAPTEEEGGISL